MHSRFTFAIGMLVALALGAPVLFGLPLDCNTSTVDSNVPQSGTTSGTGHVPGSTSAAVDAAMDDLMQQSSSVTCGPCSGTGCTLGQAGNKAQDVNPGDGGNILTQVGSGGYAAINVFWGPNGSVRVTCSACNE